MAQSKMHDEIVGSRGSPMLRIAITTAHHLDMSQNPKDLEADPEEDDDEDPEEDPVDYPADGEMTTMTMNGVIYRMRVKMIHGTFVRPMRGGGGTQHSADSIVVAVYQHLIRPINGGDTDP
ncbi:hypothetical protein Tco_1522989 [Tanacetum coccineum]